MAKISTSPAFEMKKRRETRRFVCSSTLEHRSYNQTGALIVYFNAHPENRFTLFGMRSNLSA
ncbi:hypothetical protein CEV33_0797 [Brucella grignonensis]|uniref:Uncharacterized protein n=1 Tax=Brucella grignonensis TaxID=94627 RepID=A0A256FGL6_9HYPH|nr:hypothetical protein CEV33_0797 [Brucella grignonensis]